MQVGSLPTNGNGAYLSSGGSWTNTSNENLKTNIIPVNGDDILSKISQLEISKWEYDHTLVRESHIGPMALQFKQLFDVGIENEDTSISTIDPAGIALAAIQELIRQNENLVKLVYKQQMQIEDLKERISSIEKK